MLAEVIHRVRAGKQDVPLTQRWWGPYDHEYSPQLPNLFCKFWGSELRPLSVRTAWSLVQKAQRANIVIDGQSVSYSSHDFQRIFATDALAGGFSPHVVQVLLGHKEHQANLRDEPKQALLGLPTLTVQRPPNAAVGR